MPIILHPFDPNVQPTNIDEYKAWLFNKHMVRIDGRTKNHFGMVTTAVEDQFRNSALWQHLSHTKLRDFQQEYSLLNSGFDLLSRPDAPPLHRKSFESFLEKTFGQNVSHNVDWPEPPTIYGATEKTTGWVLPNDWLVRSKDIVRTSIVVRYLDGVVYLKESLEKLADDHGIPHGSYFAADSSGHYAAHLYIVP